MTSRSLTALATAALAAAAVTAAAEGGVFGACCFPDGSCGDGLDLPLCKSLGGIYQGDGTFCGGVFCPPPGGFGACCFPDGSCADGLDQFTCEINGGIYQGDGSFCGGVFCEPPGFGACCFPDGSCADGVDQFTCESNGGNYQGDGTSCASVICPPPAFGACCFPDGTCSDGFDQLGCEGGGGNYQGDGTDCGGVICEPPGFGACCYTDGTCSDGLDQLLCEGGGGDYQGDGTTCAGVFCPQPEPPGACCFPDGSCADGLDQSGCESGGGAYQGDGTSCGGVSCPQPTGACCFPQECIDLTEAVCQGGGGAYQGDGTDCRFVDCPPVTGACCYSDGSCTDEPDEAACTSLGGSFQGADTSCSDPGLCPQPPVCTGDFDQSGDVGFADLLILLGRWGPCPGCIQDLNGSGDVGFADLLVVLGVWGPCPGPTGACCLITGSCVDVTESECAAQGGVYHGDGTDCGSSFCEPDCNGNGIPDPVDIAGGAADCNLDQIPDECQDCNGNGIGDSCEIEAGAPDCNANGIPDECEADCDGNGIPDDCDIAAGAPDCNGNGTPDQCDLDSLESLDCNGNGIPDECDIADGTSTDLDGNEVPDECGPDCNMNGIDDRVEVEVLGAPDCNDNGIPDECEPDCNGSGLPDDCDILLGLSLDCNGNGSPDECDIASGASLDFSPPNGVPDECEPASACVSPCDFWYTVDPTGADPLPSFQDFADQPIPAGFFDPGSEPFTGTVCLGGRVLDPQQFGETDTIIHRSADPFQISDPPSPVPSMVSIQITALSLTSCEPITVQAGTETSEWNVEVHLSDVAPSNGQLTAVKTHPNGGFFDSMIFVQPKFVFRRVGALSDVRILDTGVEGIPPTILQSFGTPWVHILNPELVLVHDLDSSFVPGVEEDPGTGEQVFPPVPEESDTGNEVHLVRAPCVLVVDLDIWNGLDGACNGAVNGPCGGQAVPDAVEVSRGAVTVANKNDTDGDGTVDKDDNNVSVAGATPPGRNEVDLMKLVLHKPVPDMGGFVTLSKLGGDIKVWEQSTKVTEVVLPKMYATTELPKTLWVEAREPSPMLRDIGLEMTYMGKRDEVRATGAWSFRTLAKITRAAGGAANAVPADCGVNATTAIARYVAADGSRYGPGTMRAVLGADTRIGGRILLEFMTLPNNVETLGVRWDVTRRIRYRDFQIADGTAVVAPNGLKNFPTENETPNDDNHAQDEDNTPMNQHIYVFDSPSYPLTASEAFVITRNTFKEFTRVRIHPNGPFTNKNLKLEGSRSSLKEDWHQIDYLVRGANGNRVPDTMQPSASFPLRAGAGTGTIAVAVFGGAVTEGFTVTYNLAMKKWTLTGTSGDMTMTAVAGAVPAGTQWVLTLGTKIKVTITQGATAFGNGATFTFSTFKSSAAGGKQNVINLGAIDPTSGP